MQRIIFFVNYVRKVEEWALKMGCPSNFVRHGHTCFVCYFLKNTTKISIFGMLFLVFTFSNNISGIIYQFYSFYIFLC